MIRDQDKLVFLLLFIFVGVEVVGSVVDRWKKSRE